MISLLLLREFMSLTFVKGKLYAFAPCSIFYGDSPHAVWILCQVLLGNLSRSITCVVKIKTKSVFHVDQIVVQKIGSRESHKNR
ncbi:hypothetical protein BHM03_00043553 [Ensete ventricosum]|nr:hypothetical protein BHM03_00043553 [Ensete ventricosum]